MDGMLKEQIKEILSMKVYDKMNEIEDSLSAKEIVKLAEEEGYLDIDTHEDELKEIVIEGLKLEIDDILQEVIDEYERF